MVELELTDEQACRLEHLLYLLVNDERVECRDKGLILFVIEKIKQELYCDPTYTLENSDQSLT